MRMHYLQHVAFEDPAGIAAWAIEHGHTIAGTPLFGDAALPSLNDFDWLVVMGGPMSVADSDQYAWLEPEIELIRQAISADKLVLGVCLGAQLIARALGARVYAGPHQEIGWHPVHLTPAAKNDTCLAELPNTFTAFHWHGDTYDLPDGATQLAASDAYPQQAFQLGRRVLGLQFHVESTPDTVAKLIQYVGHEIGSGPYAQSTDAMQAGAAQCRDLRPLLDTILTRLVAAAE